MRGGYMFGSSKIEGWRFRYSWKEVALHMEAMW